MESFCPRVPIVRLVTAKRTPCATAYCNVAREYTAHATSRIRNRNINIGSITSVNSNISDPRCFCLRKRDQASPATGKPRLTVMQYRRLGRQYYLRSRQCFSVVIFLGLHKLNLSRRVDCYSIASYMEGNSPQ